jgi:hypothetical protein
MFRILARIAAFAKRLDTHLTRGVEMRGRRLAGLKPLAGARPLNARPLKVLPPRQAAIAAH